MASRTDELIMRLANTTTDETLFNPYNQICKNHDLSTAPGLRQGNLRIYLDSYKNAKMDVLWVFDAADFYSTKLSGVPLVEPLSYKRVESILGLSIHFDSANKSGVVSDTHKSHNDIWDLMSKQIRPPLIWNVLPFYPHDRSDISIKRDPVKAEYIKYGEFVRIILDIYGPKNVLAVGSKTKNALAFLNIKSKLLLID